MLMICPKIEAQMYADNNVIYVHSNTKSQIASILTNAMAHVTKWLNHCCLQVNVSKTTSTYFTKTKIRSCQRIQISYTQYSDLSIKTQAKKVCNRVKNNLANFRFIRNCMSTEAARMYMNAMIILHLTYCLTSWSSSSNLRPLESLYKQTMKILDKKPNSFQ